MFTIQLVLFLFLSSAALVRRAQNEFYKNDGHNPLRGLFQFEGGNIAQGKESLDSGNIQKVVGILQNNIKQWSFIESQLLEPNVNLGMPEIFIPLKHLTTTLEILGNIFFVQNDLSAAQSHLERACPLMELLPPNLLSDEDFAAAAGEALEDSGLRLLDPTDLTSYLWMGTGTGSGPGQRQGQGHGAAQGGSTDGSTKSNTYAAGCYSLLRDVYAKLYGENDNNKNREIAPVDSTGSPPALAANTAGSTNGHIPSPREFPVSTTTLKYSPHQAGYHSFVLPNGKPREFNLKYLLSKRQQRQQMKARALYSRYNSSSRDTSSGSGSGSTSTNPTPLTGAGARSTKVSGAKLSMAGATAGTAFLEKSLSAAAAAQQQQQQQQQGEGGEMEAGHRRRNHALLLGVDGDGLYDDDLVDDTPVTSASTSASTNARRTSVFSEADEEEEQEQVELTPPAAMPAIASDSELGVDIAGADSRKPSPLRSDVNSVHSHAHSSQVPQARNFDFEQKLRDLRSPYEHLRSELQLVQDLQNQNSNLNLKNNKNNKNKKTKQRQPSSKRSGSAAEPQPAATESDDPDTFSSDDDADAEFTGGSSSGGRRVGLGLSSSSPSVAGPKRSNKAPQPVVRGFEGSSLNHISGEDITAPGVSTSIIADDLETLLRKFVQANVRNKKELLLQARKYYDELDINFPNMDYNEYAANMDVGQAYLEVMTKVVQDGFAFVSTELDQWGVAAAEAQRQHQQQQAGSAGGAKGKGKANKGESTAGNSNKDKVTASKESAAAPLQVTMAEKNRLLVLYAFDLVHTNPSDSSDLGLGFNRGIVDNDRGRRGDHFMVDALSDAVASLGLDNALAGLLGFHGEVNDAHKRLFPHDSASASASSQHSAAHHAAASLLKDGNNVLDKLTEQHLRDLLNSEVGGTGGGTTAEEYLAARAAAKAAAAGPSASPSGGASSSDSSGSSSGSSSQSTKAAKTKRRKQRQQQMEGGGEYTREDNNNYRPTNSGGGYFGGAGQDGDGAGDIFYDDDMMGGGSMRSVPTLNSGADGDWTLSLFVLFMLLTGAVVYSAYQEAARKKLATGRTRSRPAGSAGGGHSGASGKKTSAVLLSGTAVVDFMYAQLNGPSPSAASEETDPDGDAKSAAASANATSTAGTSKLSWMFFKPDVTSGTASNGSHGSNGNNSGSANGSGKASKKAAAKETALAQSDKASENAATAKVKDSHGAASAAATTNSTTASGAGSSGNGKAKGKKGKEKEKSKEGTTETHTTAAASASVPPAPVSTNTSATPQIPASNSSTSLQSATDDSLRSSIHEDSNSSSDDEFVTSSSSHPVSVNHRRVSWAGLIPGATTIDPVPAPRGGFAGEMGITEQGDWAEARKKGSKRNTVSSGGASEEKAQEHPQPQRIALGLKDSPLYRQQPRPYQPHQGQVMSGRGIPNSGSADVAGAAASSRKPPTFVPGQSQGQGPGHGQSRSVSAADIAAGVSSAAPLPYSRAAAGAAAAAGSGVATSNNTSSITRGVSSRAPAYDLSEAKRMAEQMGGWSVGSAPAATAKSSNSNPSVSVAASSTTSTTTSTSAAAPPGLLPLRTVASAHSGSSAFVDSPRSLASGGASPANSTATKGSQQFGFSQFDLSTASTASAMNYSAASGASWGASSTTSHPSLASLAASLSGNNSVVSGGGRGAAGGSINSALAAQSAYSACSGNVHLGDVGDLGSSHGSSSAYLSDIVSFLDSPAYKPSGKASSSRAPMSDLYGDLYRRQEGGAGLYAAAASATATTSTVSAASLDFGGSAASGSGVLGSDYDSLHVDEAGYYHVPSTLGAGDQQPGQDNQSELYYQQLYGSQPYAADEGAYYAQSEYQQQYGEYEGEENHSFSAPEHGAKAGVAGGRERRRDHGGLRQAALQQPTADFAPSITLEASSLYGLSPDAPSFRPSQLRSSTGASTASNGNHGDALGVSASRYTAVPDASTSGINRLSAFSGRYEEPLPPPPPLSLSMSLGSPSLSLFGDTLPLPALLQPSSATSGGSSALGMFNTDDFYDNIMIDSTIFDSILGEEAEGDGAEE